MVSAACLAGRQTILVCFFFRQLWICRKRKETNRWNIKNATGHFLVQIHPSRFVSKVICPVPKISIEARMFFFSLFLIEWPYKHYNFQTWLRDNLVPRVLEMAFQSIQISKFSGGNMAPDPPRLMGLTAPCSYRNYSKLIPHNLLRSFIY